MFGVVMMGRRLMWVWDVIRYIGPRPYARILAPYRGDGGVLAPHS